MPITCTSFPTLSFSTCTRAASIAEHASIAGTDLRGSEIGEPDPTAEHKRVVSAAQRARNRARHETERVIDTTWQRKRRYKT